MGSTSDVSPRRRWLILSVMYISALAFALTLQSVPPVLSLIMDELKLSHTEGGLLMSFFSLPAIFVAIPAGILADRYSQKSIAVVSFVLIIAGTAVFATANSLPVILLGRVVAGAGAMTLVVISPQILAQWFAGHELGRAMGMYNTGMPLGTIISLNLLSRVGASMGWRTSIWVSAGLALVALIVFSWLFTPAPRSGHVKRAPVTGLWLSIRQTGVSIWLVGIGWLLFNAAIISLFTFTPDFLEASGFSVAVAGFTTSAVMWPALVISPLVGYTIDKIGRKETIIGIGGVALAVLFALVPSSIGWLLGLMLLIGVAQSLVPAPTFSLAPDVTSPERLGLGYGIISTCLNVGIVVGPATVGLVRDVTGSYQSSYMLMAGLALLVSVTMLVLHFKQRRKPA